jgi:GNAT superfamily N-acetyltransferase
LSDLDNEQNPINWLIGQPVDATEIGGETYTPKQTLSEMITTMLASANKDVPEARQVLKRTAMDVVERSLYKTIGVSDVHQRVFAAERELADYLNMAINGHQPVVAGGHTDLLPIGHPLSTNPSEVSLRTRALSESEWVSADPRISEEFRPLVASIYLTSPGSVEHNFLVARLESADIKDVPKDVVLAVTAAGNPFGGGNSFLERSARAKLQRRDRLGRFAFMGGGARAFVRLANGFIQSVVGRFVGVGTDSDTFDVEFIDDPVLGTGIYRMKTQNVAGVRAFIRNLRGLLKNVRPKSATYASGYAVDAKDLKKVDAPNGWEVDATPLNPDEKHTKKFNAADGYGVRQYNNVNDIPSYEETSKNKDVEVKGLGKKGAIDPKYPVYELYTDPLNSQDKDKFDSDEPTLIGYYQSWGDLQSSTQRFDKKAYQKVDSREEREMWGDAPDGDHPQGVFEQVNPSDDKTPFSTYRSRNNANGNGGYTVRRFQPEKHGDAKADMDREVADGAEVRGFKSGSSEMEPDQPIFEVTRQPAPWERNTEPDVIGYAQDWEDVQAMAEASELAMPRGENPRRKAIKKFKQETGLDYVDEKDVVLPSDFEEYENGRLYYIPKDVNADRARITRDYRGQYVAEFYDNAEDQKNLKPSRTITSRTKEEALLDAAEHLTEEKSIKSAPTPEEKERSEAEILAQPKPTRPEVKKPSEEIFPIPDVSNVIGADGKPVDPALLEWYADADGIRIPDANLKDSDKTPENRRIRDLDNNRVLDGNGREVEFDPKYSPDADPRPDVHPDHEDGFWDANEVNDSEVQRDITDPQLAYEALFDGGFIEVDQRVAIDAVTIAMEDRKFIGPDDNAIGRSRLARALSSALQGLPTSQANRLRRAINPAALSRERAQELLDFINSKSGDPLTTDEMKMLHRKYRNMGVDLTNMKMEGTSNYLNNNLGAERGKMPQLSTPEDQADFEAALGRLGIKFEAKTMTPDQLTPVQAEMDMGNVGLIKTSWLDPELRKKFGMDDQVLYVTRDGYVIDGHHRWASALLAQIDSGKPIELKCVVVDLDHEDALRICNEYNDHIGVTRQTLGATSADAKATPKREVDGEVGRKGNPPKDSTPPVSTPLAEPPDELPDRQPVARLPEGAPAPQSPPPLPNFTETLPEPKKATKRIPTPVSAKAFVDRQGTDIRKFKEYGTGFVLTTPDPVGGTGIVPTPEKLEEFENWLDTHKDADNEVKKRISSAMVEKYGPNWAEKFIEVSSAVNRKNEIYGELRAHMRDLWEKNLGGAGEIKMKIASDIRRAVQSGEIKFPDNDAAMREFRIQQLIDETLRLEYAKWDTLANAVAVIREKYPDSEYARLINEGYEVKARIDLLSAEESEMNADLSKFAQREYRKYLEESGVEMYSGDGSEIFEVSGTLRHLVQKGFLGREKEETKNQEEDEETLRQVEVAFRSALSRYPKWMVDRLEKIIAKTPSGKLQVSINYTEDPNFTKRGFFQIIDGNLYIQISKNNNPTHGLLDFEETAAHEIGHALEAAIPEIRALEWSLLTSRTRRFAGGEARPIGKLESVVPGQPNSDELGILDDFRNTYASRIYGPLNPNSYYEVFTMTQERMQGGGTHRVTNKKILEDVKSGKITAEQAILGDTDTTMALGIMLDGGDSELTLADEQVRKGAVLEVDGWSKKGSPELVDTGFVDETQNLSDQASTKRSKKSEEIISRIADVGDKRAIVNEDYGGYVDVYQKGRYDAPDGKTYTMYFRETQFPNDDGTFTISGGVDITDGTDDVGEISYSEVRKVLDYKGNVIWDETALPLWYSKDLYDVTKPFSTIKYVEVASEARRKGIATALLEFARRHSATPIHHSQELLDDGRNFAKAVQSSDVLIEDLPVLEGDTSVSSPDLYGAQSEKAKQIESRIVPSDKEPVVKKTKLPSFINNVDHTMVMTTTDSVYTTESGEKFIIRREVEEVVNDSTGEVTQLRGTVFAFPEGQNIPDDIDEDSGFVSQIDYVGGKKDISTVADEYRSTVDDSKPFATIYGIATDPEHQRKGLATALLSVARKDSAMPVYHSSLRTMDGYRFSQAIQNSTDVLEELPDLKETPETKKVASRVKIKDDLEKTELDRLNGEKEFGVTRTAEYTDEDGVVYNLVFTLGGIVDENGETVGYYRRGSVRAYTKDKNSEYMDTAGVLDWEFTDNLGMVAPEAQPDVDLTKPFNFIRSVVVYPSYTRKGLATAMLQFARSQDEQPIYHSSVRTAEGYKWSTQVKSPDASTEELPDNFSSGDPKNLTKTDINYLIESSPVTKNTATFQQGKKGIGSLSRNGYKENSLEGYKPNFDADGDAIHEKIYTRAIESGLSDKDAEELATKQTTEIRNFIQRKNDKSRMAYLVEKAITPPEGASEKVVKERTRWAKIWDKNTTTVKERVSKALATGRVVEPVSKESFMDIVENNGKFNGVGFIADDFSTGKSESESVDSIGQKMKSILSIKNKKHASKIKVVFKNSVRKNTKYTVGDSLNSASIPSPLDSRDEDSMVLSGLMGNANGAFISMSGMGAPKNDDAQIQTSTTGDLGLPDVEAVYVSGEEDAREIRQALDENFPDIDVVDLDGSESDRKDVGLNFLRKNDGQIQNSLDEIQEELPTPDPDSPERQMSEKAKAVRKNLSVDTVPEVVATEKMSFGDTREYLEGRGSYLTPNGDMIDLVFEEKRNYNREGQKETDTVTITAFDDNYNLVGLLEVNMVEFDTDDSGIERYSLKGIDEVAHPEILGKQDSATPLAEISWIKVEDDYQRQGIGTALLEFARDTFPMPIYHSNNLSPDGRKYSKAVQTSENVEEDLPSVEETTPRKPIPPLVEDEAPEPEATAEASDKARIVRERALEIEPKITEDVAKVAKVSGGVLKSLENRIKTTGSLARKIDKDAVELFNGDRADAALRISDAVRYTMVTSTADYVAAIKQVKAEFLDLGYEVQNEKNFWKSSEYKGFTFKLVSPEGYAVEFQIHTDESYEIKDDLHKLYKELRKIPVGTNVPKRRQLSFELEKLADLIPVPEDEELFQVGKLVQYNPDKKLTRLGDEFEEFEKPEPQKPQAPQTSETLTEEDLPETTPSTPLVQKIKERLRKPLSKNAEEDRQLLEKMMDNQYGENAPEEKKILDEKLNQHIEDAELSVRVFPEAFEKILESGKLENIFARSKSEIEDKKTVSWARDEAYMGSRRAWEEANLGISDNASADDRPIYLSAHTPNESTYEEAKRYGSVKIIFKPELKKRSTFTTADSLNKFKIPFRYGEANVDKIDVNEAISDARKIGVKVSDPNFKPFSTEIWGEDVFNDDPKFIEAQVMGGISRKDMTGTLVVDFREENSPSIEQLQKWQDAGFEIVLKDKTGETSLQSYLENEEKAQAKIKKDQEENADKWEKYRKADLAQLEADIKRLNLTPLTESERADILSGKLTGMTNILQEKIAKKRSEDSLNESGSKPIQSPTTTTEEDLPDSKDTFDVDLWGDPILAPVEGSFYDDDGNYKYGPRGKKSKEIFKRIFPTGQDMDRDGDMVYTADFIDEEGNKFNLINRIDSYASKGVVQIYSTGAYPQRVGEIIYSEVPISNDEDGLLTWDRNQLPPWYPEENYDIYNPFATIDIARVSTGQQRRGLATAMLEFARSTNSMPIHHSYNLSEMGQQFAQAIQNAPTLEIENEDLPKLDEVKSVAERIDYGPQNQGDSLFQQTATYKAEDGTEYKMDMTVYVNPESPFKNKTANIEILHEGKFVGRLSWQTAFSYFEDDGEQVWLPRSEMNRVAPESIDSVDTSKPFSIIDSLAVSEDSRRKGIATAMLTFARESSDEPIYHSQDRTDDGKAFSRAVQSPVLLEDMDELPVRDEVPFRDTRLNRRPDRRAVRRLARKGLNSKERAESKKRNRLTESPSTIGDEAKLTPTRIMVDYAEALRTANLERLNFSQRVTEAMDSLEADGITKKDIADSIHNPQNLVPWEGKIDISKVLVLDSVTGRALSMYEYSNMREVNEQEDILKNKRGKSREVTFEEAKEILRKYGGYGSGNRRYVLLSDTEVSVPTVARKHIEKTFRALDKNLSIKPETSQQLEEELPTYDYEPMSSKSREVAERIVEDPSKSQTWPDEQKVLNNVDNNVDYWLRLYMGSDSILDFDETFTLEDYKRLDEYRLNPPVTEITVSEREHVATYKAVGGGDTYKLTMTVKEIKDSKTGKVLAVSGRGEASSEKDFTSGGEFLFASPNVNGIDEQGNFLYDARFIARETRENITRDDLKKPFGFVTGVYVDEDVQRQGIATALLEFARQKAGVPIYHSSNRSDEGYAFSTAVKSPQLVEEDLPPLAEGQSSEGRTLSEKSREVKARISTNSPRQEVRKDGDGNPIYQSKGTYKTPSGEVLNLLLEDTETTSKEDNIRYINGFVDISDKNSRVLGSLSFGVPYDYMNYPNSLDYDIGAVDRDIHPEASPDSPFAVIDFISVFPTRQREGIATAMLEFARENFNLPIYHSTDRTARGNAFADAVQSPETSDEELPTPTVASSIVSGRDKNIQELLDTNAIASIEDATKIKEYGAGVGNLDIGTTISLGLGQHETRSDKFMQRLWELNLQYLQKSLGIIDWKVEQQTIDKMKAMGLSDRASKRAAAGALLAAKAYAKVKNFAEAMSKIAKTMAEEFPEDRWFAGYYKRALVTREVLKDKLKTAVPVISADFDSALGIISDKRFKTQWETGSSNGLYEPSTREKREFGLLAVDPKTPKSKRPIYGFMATDDDGKTPMAKPHNMDLFAVNNRAISQYGDVRFVLKPETRERTTFTMQDSLDVIALPQPLSDNPTDEQIDMAGFWQNVTDSHDGFFREPYVEAQVSGGVSMEDVERIVVSVPYYTDYPEAQAKFLKRKVDTLRAELDAAGYENIQITTVTETPSESYQDEAMNISGIPL